MNTELAEKLKSRANPACNDKSQSNNAKRFRVSGTLGIYEARTVDKQSPGECLGYRIED
jgi:hypothetical protein